MNNVTIETAMTWIHCYSQEQMAVMFDGRPTMNLARILALNITAKEKLAVIFQPDLMSIADAKVARPVLQAAVVNAYTGNDISLIERDLQLILFNRRESEERHIVARAIDCANTIDRVSDERVAAAACATLAGRLVKLTSEDNVISILATVFQE